MAQPVKTKRKNINSKPKKNIKKTFSVSDIIKKNIEKNKKPHPKYGTSKLEKKFAKEFLEKLGVEYKEQFEAKDIKRFYDFAIYTPKGSIILIEIDGVYWHGKGLLHEEKNGQQKKAEYVDKIKNEWAHAHGIPLIRIWEDDINKNPSKVMKELEEKLGFFTEKIVKKERKKERNG